MNLLEVVGGPLVPVECKRAVGRGWLILVRVLAALAFVGVAVVVPSANSLLGRRVAPAERPLAISRAWMLGFSGFFVGPVAMGWIAEGIGLRGGFVAVAGVIGLILVGLAVLLRRPLRG